MHRRSLAVAALVLALSAVEVHAGPPNARPADDTPRSLTMTEKAKEKSVDPSSLSEANAQRHGDDFDMQNGEDFAGAVARGEDLPAARTDKGEIEVFLDGTYGYGEKRYGPGLVTIPMGLAQSLGHADADGNEVHPFDQSPARAARARGQAAAEAIARQNAGKVDESSTDSSIKFERSGQGRTIAAATARGEKPSSDAGGSTSTTVSGKSADELGDMTTIDLAELADAKGIEVKRGDGEDGRPLKADYVKALSKKA